MKDTETIYFAGGCFWGTEHFMKQIPGVISTTTGYANSTVDNPSYRQVCTGDTSCCRDSRGDIQADSVSLPFLIDLYFKTIDPTSVNRQGGDSGTQYRTGIYYTEPSQRDIIEREIAALARDIRSRWLLR